MTRDRLGALGEAHYLAALVFYLAFLASIQVIALLLSVLGVIVSQWVACTILLTSLAMGWFNYRIVCSSHAVSSRDTGAGETDRLPRVLVAFTVFIYLCLWVCAYLQPDLTCDGNLYHIPPIHFWAVRGFVHWIPDTFEFNGMLNGYPKAAELSTFVFFRALAPFWMVTTANLVFLPVGVAAVAWLARSLGAGPVVAMLAGTTLLVLPVSINQAGNAYVDVAYAACVISSLILLASILACVSCRVVPWRLLPSLGMSVGLAAAIKPTGLILPVLAAGGFAVATLVSWRARPSDRARVLPRAVSALLLVMTVAFGVTGYWYVRNYVTTGSPLFPVGLKVGSYVVFPGMTASEAIFEVPNTPDLLQPLPGIARVFLTWLQTPPSWPRSILGTDSRLGGLGYLWLLGCIPAIALTLFHRRNFARHPDLTIWILCALTLLMLLATPMNWWARYTFWLYAAGLPCLGLVASGILRINSPYRLGRAWLLACLLVVLVENGLCMTVTLWHCYPRRPLSSFSDFLHLGNWKWPVCYIFQDMNGTSMEQVFSGSAGVAFGPLRTKHSATATGTRWKFELVGQAFQPIGRRPVLFLPGSPQPEDFRRLARDDIRYVVWDDEVPVPPDLEKRSASVERISGFLLFTLSAPGREAFGPGRSSPPATRRTGGGTPPRAARAAT